MSGSARRRCPRTRQPGQALRCASAAARSPLASLPRLPEPRANPCPPTRHAARAAPRVRPRRHPPTRTIGGRHGLAQPSSLPRHTRPDLFFPAVHHRPRRPAGRRGQGHLRAAPSWPNATPGRSPMRPTASGAASPNTNAPTSAAHSGRPRRHEHGGGVTGEPLSPPRTRPRTRTAARLRRRRSLTRPVPARRGAPAGTPRAPATTTATATRPRAVYGYRSGYRWHHLPAALRAEHGRRPLNRLVRGLRRRWAILGSNQ